MTGDQLLEVREELIRICRPVSDFIKGEMKRVRVEDIEEKELNSLVSYVDTEAEKMIVKELEKLIPDAGYITEENTVLNVVKKYNWIIDPLDGTTNYLYGIPHFSISIGLNHNSRTVAGIVYEVMQDIAYTAVREYGAWEDNHLIHVRNTSEDKEAIVVTGFPYKRLEDIEESVELLKYCISNYRGIRRLGSAALDLAYVAAGKVDIYYERSLNIWDLAAGALLVEEAGGRVTDYDGSDEYLHKGHIVACNGTLHPRILKAIQKHLF